MKQDRPVNPAVKPIQTLSWAEKEKNKKQWYKSSADYAISNSGFSDNNGYSRRDYGMLYEVYNNKFPMKWFDHVTDPLSAKVKAHKSFPAKIRPVTILRTNLDQLMAEYPRRPFIYTVNNLGENGYNTYTQALKEKVDKSVQEYFDQVLTAAMNPEQLAEHGQNPQPAPIPEEIKKQHHATYKDAQAIKAQKWLKRALGEYKIRNKFQKMFKDWVIVGEAASYKGMEHGTFCYEHISPMNIDYVSSEYSDFAEDAERIVVRRRMTVSDIVDRFYEDFKKEEIVSLETGSARRSPESFYEYVFSTSTVEDGLIDVWHVTWKARKQVNILSTTDPDTGELLEIQVDEDYKPAEGETMDTIWPNEIYETWRIGADKYVRMQPIPVQRNEMNNFSACKHPYNARKFSATHAENISVMEIGIPFQIMYIIVTRTLELTIAKSKGKIMLIDQAAIPNHGDWTEEKFFYYSEALGYGLLNRNQVGVDKSWNQYTVLDMSLFDSIKQLIDLQNHFKQQWDDVIGFNRQRKGQTYASDLVGTTERATFQSTIITDMLFNLFEEFTETELQGIIDFSKFVNVDGVKAVWNDDVFGNQVLEIDPNEYCNAELGIVVQSSAEAMAKKNKMENTITAMLQNNVKASTITEIVQMDSISELRTKLKEIEALQAQAEESALNSEAERNAASDERKEKFARLDKLLKSELMNEEYDRKEEIELIRGDFNTLTFKDGDSNLNGVPDANEVEKRKLDRDKLNSDNEHKNADRMERVQADNNKTILKQQELKSNERKEYENNVTKRMAIRSKPKTTKK